jgi:predicted GNAT family acetyltransferase
MKREMTYRTVTFPDASSFLSRVGEMLKSHEARFGLALGLARRLVDEPHAYGEVDPWFASVESGTQVCAAAMRTPPHKLILAFFGGDLTAISDALVPVVSQAFGSIPGVVGQSEIVKAIAARWCDSQGITVRSTMEQRIYKLTEVRCDIPANGLFRRAGEADKQTVAAWTMEFHKDIYGEEPPDRIAEEAHARVDRGDTYLWCDGEPVSMCASTRPTDHGITISGVYTPPEKRGRGYATVCVASLCNELLGRGYRFCVLYTDAGNPTSNEVYRRIGFVEIGGSVDVVFAPA